MPYCPKCDMEFVEGVTVCSDCKGPLLSSPEEAKALQKEAEQKALEEARNFFGEYFSDEKTSNEGLPEDTSVTEILQKDDKTEEITAENHVPEDVLAIMNGTTKLRRPPSSVYVKKSERYQDMKSSASAFLLIGCTALLLSILIFTGIIPLAGMNQLSFGGILAVMGIGCLVVCIKTKKEAAGIRVQADEENQKTQELIQCFLKKHSARELDEQLAAEQGRDSDCTPEERSLKRFSLIQDYLAVEHDLPDPAYIDALSEEIYNRMFEN